MANNAVTVAYEIGDELAEKHKLYVVDIQLKKEAGKQFLRIFIDKEGGVGIDDCESFSREFEELYDARDPIKTEYTLEVSSPGLDRKLKTEREFKHFKGREVDVKLFAETDGLKEFCGILSDFEDNIAKIDCNGKNVSINIKDAAYIKLHFEF